MGHVLIVGGIRVLEAIFAAGIVGSAIVVFLAGAEDVADIFRPEKTPTERGPDR